MKHKDKLKLKLKLKPKIWTRSASRRKKRSTKIAAKEQSASKVAKANFIRANAEAAGLTRLGVYSTNFFRLTGSRKNQLSVAVIIFWSFHVFPNFFHFF